MVEFVNNWRFASFVETYVGTRVWHKGVHVLIDAARDPPPSVPAPIPSGFPGSRSRRATANNSRAVSAGIWTDGKEGRRAQLRRFSASSTVRIS